MFHASTVVYSRKEVKAWTGPPFLPDRHDLKKKPWRERASQEERFLISRDDAAAAAGKPLRQLSDAERGRH